MNEEHDHQTRHSVQRYEEQEALSQRERMHRILPVEEPKPRGRVRRIIGREFYTMRRRLDWLQRRNEWARTISASDLPYEITSHRSLLLRPLHGVDMQLQRNKITNLRLAIAHLDRLVIEPGETFSLWRLVGRPSERKGYLEGLVLRNGTIDRGVGGGLCQLGNLLYWMSLHSPLAVTERWRHGYDVFPDVNRTLPFGSGATLAYNYIDLQLTNNTDARYQLRLELDATHLQGNIRSDRESLTDYEIFETDHQFQVQWWGGYTRHNQIWRRTTDRRSGDVQIEFVTANHAVMMYEPMIESGMRDQG